MREQDALSILEEFNKANESQARDERGRWTAGNAVRAAALLHLATRGASTRLAGRVIRGAVVGASRGAASAHVGALRGGAGMGRTLAHTAGGAAAGFVAGAVGGVRKSEDAAFALLQDFVKHNYDPNQPRDDKSGRWVRLDENEDRQKRDLVRNVALGLAGAGAAAALALLPGTRALASHLAGKAWSAAKAIGARAIKLSSVHPAAGGGVHATFSAADAHFAATQGFSVQGHPLDLTGAAKGALQQIHDATLRNGVPMKGKLTSPFPPSTPMPE